MKKYFIILLVLGFLCSGLVYTHQARADFWCNNYCQAQNVIKAAIKAREETNLFECRSNGGDQTYCSQVATNIADQETKFNNCINARGTSACTNFTNAKEVLGVCISNPNSPGCNGSTPLIGVTNNNATTMCVNDTAPGAQISLPINGSCPASAPNSISKPSVVCTEDGNIFLPAANGACPNDAPAHKNGVPTQQYNKTLTYTPLEPLPGYSALNGTQDFGKLVSLLFKLLIGAGALIAVGSFVYAGVYYMFSEISVTNKSWAKKKIQSSFFGLFLLMGSWLILNTINQQLVVFGNGLNPVQENIATGFQQAPQSQLQRDIGICESEGGALKYQMTAGRVLGCPSGSVCSNAISPSSGYCLLPGRAAN